MCALLLVTGRLLLYALFTKVAFCYNFLELQAYVSGEVYLDVILCVT